MDWSDYIPTVVRIPLAVYNNRKLLQSFWVKILAKLDVGSTDIAILGTSGAGKTYLSKFLHDQAPKFNFKAGLSPDVETEAIQFGEWAKLVRVVPGQGGKERSRGLDEVFNSETLEGIVYVVDWGYSEIRDNTLKESLIKDQGLDTLDKFREKNLKEEIKDFTIIADKIKSNNALGRGPKWLIIAVNKIDLFYSTINDAQKYYSPEYKSDFTIILNDLLSAVGNLHVRCIALPISSWQKSIEWNGTVIKTDLGGKKNFRKSHFTGRKKIYNYNKVGSFGFNFVSTDNFLSLL